MSGLSGFANIGKVPELRKEGFLTKIQEGDEQVEEPRP